MDLISIKMPLSRPCYAATMTDPAAMVDLLVEPLSPIQVATVFPLMRAADPGLSLADWRRFARTVTTKRQGQHGVLVARRQTLQHPSGAVCYRRHRDLHDGAVLTAEHFVALDLLYPDRIIAALIAGLEPVAKRLGCGTIRSIVHGDAAALIVTLQSQGHMAEAVTLVKDVSVQFIARDKRTTMAREPMPAAR